jgi:hypothetical protein
MKIRPQIRKHHLPGCLLLVCSGLLACAGANNEAVVNNPADAVQQRIIIAFDSAAIDPEDPQVMQSISKVLGTDLQFIRRLSGNAAVYTGNLRQNKQGLAVQLEQLKSLTYIKYAEPDQRREIQPRR